MLIFLREVIVNFIDYNNITSHFDRCYGLEVNLFIL